MAALPTNNIRPTRDRTKWRANMDKINKDDEDNAKRIEDANKQFEEKSNTLTLDVEKEFKWSKYISFKDKIDGVLIANKGEISIPIAMKPIKEGKSISKSGNDSSISKGKNADFYAEVAWLGFKGFHYENAAIFMRDYDEMFDIRSLMEDKFTENELLGLETLLQASMVKPNWKLVRLFGLFAVVALFALVLKKSTQSVF